MAQSWSHIGPDVAEKVRTACLLVSPCAFRLLAGWSVSSFKLLLPRRGLRFIQILLQSLADGEKDEDNPNLIRVNIIKAYEQALKKYHSWLVQKVFNVRKRLYFSFFCIQDELCWFPAVVLFSTHSSSSPLDGVVCSSV